MGPRSHLLAVDPEAIREEWAIVEALVRGLGSTLDLPSLAERIQRLLADELELGATLLCVLDAGARRLDVHGVRPEGWGDLHLPWTMSERLVRTLRRRPDLFELQADDLPSGLVDRSARVALSLRDGGDVVGFVVLCERAPDQIPSDDLRGRLRVVGGLVGAALSRALVHKTLVDVTGRLETAQRLQQHILDHVSHEFNTPLMILRSSIEFADTDDADERAAFLDMQEQAVARLEQLVQGVLEVARSRSHGRKQSFGRRELFQAILDPCLDRYEWPSSRRHVAVAMPADLSVRADPDGLALVLDHLLRNAWQFGGEQGASVAVVVRALRREDRDTTRAADLDAALAWLADPSRPVADPSGDAEADHLAIEVIDDGIGIPEDELEFVLEPFTQASNSPLRGVSGAGMGLPTCRKRMESMGGTLWLDSHVGRGTRVTLLLPL